MDEIDKLLMTAINLHYRERPNVIAKAMEVLNEYYNAEQTDVQYDEVLKTLHDLMNDLPSNILLYFLTTIPFANQDITNKSTFSALMKKSHTSLEDNILTILTEYLNSAMPPLVAIDLKKSNTDAPVTEDEASSSSEEFTNGDNSITVARTPESTEKQVVYSCKALLDICADYVILNSNKLMQMYEDKNVRAWRLLDDVNCKELKMLIYQLIEDLNKKRDWLRMIQNGYVSADVLKNEYPQSEAMLVQKYLREHNIANDLNICKELKDAIELFITT